MITSRKPSIKHICTITLCMLLLSGCSGSSDSASSDDNGAIVVDNFGSNADDPAEGQTLAGDASGSGAGNTNEPATNEIAEPFENQSENDILESTRVTFNITVPVYVSNALQVRLTWGDKDINASWVVDESWVIEDDFPTNTNNPLEIMFSDDNGAVTLGSFETDLNTGIQPTQIYSITADQFNTEIWDNNGNGVSNLDELLAASNAQTREAPAAVSATLTLVPDKTVRIAWQSSVEADFYRVFENPDGKSGLTQVSDDLDASSVQFDHVVPLHKRVNAEYMVQACNAVGCTDSSDLLEVGDLESGLALVQPTHNESGDGFANVIVLSADAQTLVVTAPGEDSAATGVNGDQFDNSLSGPINNSYLAGTGAAYVFSRVDGSWQQQAYLKASNTMTSHHFGTSASISADGNTVAVGAYGDRSSSTGINGSQADDLAIRTGAVYVYVRNNGTWTQQAYVKASNAEADNYFGRAVGLSADGNTLAVGAHDEKSDTTEINGDQTQGSSSNSGAVYMYSRQNNIWTQQAYLKAFREGSDFCCFGGLGRMLSLSADGKTLAAGMQYRSERAIVFTQIDGSWLQTATIESPHRQLDGDFGERLSLSADGKTLAITAVGENPKDEQGNTISGTEEGVAYIFDLIDGLWQEQAYFYLAEHDNGRRFGLDISLSGDGNTVAISFNFNRLYIHTRTEGAWSHIATLPDESPIPPLSISRPSLSWDGDTLAVGGGNLDTGRFGVFLF